MSCRYFLEFFVVVQVVFDVYELRAVRQFLKKTELIIWNSVVHFRLQRRLKDSNMLLSIRKCLSGFLAELLICRNLSNTSSHIAGFVTLLNIGNGKTDTSFQKTDALKEICEVINVAYKQTSSATLEFEEWGHKNYFNVDHIF